MITTCTFIFLIAFIFECYSLHKIIYVSHKKQLFDEPSEDRKIHLIKIPNLGGVGTFASMLFTSSLFLQGTAILHLNYILTSAVILFSMGLTDDIVGMNHYKKIMAQIAVALILTVLAEYRFTSFHGFLGFEEMSFGMSIVFSTLFILLLINAFNLIDGINCLSGTIGLLACLTFAYCFWKMHETGFLFLSIALSGCLVGFLFYNRTPAKIFMGDTGALFLGFMMAIFSIYFIEFNKVTIAQPQPPFKSAPVIVFSLLIIPIFDTVRVFVIRILKRRSPFHADKNHIHHLLLNLKFTHLQATGILLLATMASLAISLIFQDLGTWTTILINAILILLLNWILWFFNVRQTTMIGNQRNIAIAKASGYPLDLLDSEGQVTRYPNSGPAKKSYPVLEQ